MAAKYFPPPGPIHEYCNAPDALLTSMHDDTLLPQSLVNKLDLTGRSPAPGDVKYIFLTKAGPGPQEQPMSECLLSPVSGFPVPASKKHARMQISQPTIRQNSDESALKSSSSNGISWGSVFLITALSILTGYVVGRKYK